MKMQGYNGSQGWDSSFAMQAIAEAGLVEEFPQMCSLAFSYLDGFDSNSSFSWRELGGIIPVLYVQAIWWFTLLVTVVGLFVGIAYSVPASAFVFIGFVN